MQNPETEVQTKSPEEKVVDNNIIIPKNYIVFNKPTDLEISQKKYDSYREFCRIIQLGRKNPIWFAETFFGVTLLDNQKYVFMKSWNTPFNIWLESRAMGKTTLGAIFLMDKAILFNDYKAVISSGTATQSIETYKKIEDIAKNNITSFTGSTDIFLGEVVRHAANSDGFIHNPASFTFQLYNGSNVRTINSSVDTQRGKRANLVFFDEAGWLPEEVLTVIGAYTTNSSDFKLGGNVDVRTIPKEIPNQIVIASSASSVDTELYKRYRDYAKKMFLGDSRYFVADLNCDVAINATYKGQKYPVSLLTQETVDTELRANPYKANREYYNRFTQDGGENQIIKREWITRNSITAPPILASENEGDEFVFTYDSARVVDNSFILIGKFVYDKEKGWTMFLCNGINFADVGLRNKTPMRMPEQMDYIRELLLTYNGDALDYENITMYSDAGSGGGGTIIPDYLIEPWHDRVGLLHPGIVDEEYSKDQLDKFADAKRILHVMSPSTYKAQFYEALIQCVQNDWFIFTEEYNQHGFLNIVDVNQKHIEKVRAKLKRQKKSDEYIAKYLKKLDTASTKMRKLSPEEEISLNQLDMLKEEMVNICRYKTESAKDRFALPAHKNADSGINHSNNTLHDDRAYCAAMLAYALLQRRNADRLSKYEKKGVLTPAELLSSTLKKKTLNSFRAIG